MYYVDEDQCPDCRESGRSEYYEENGVNYRVCDCGYEWES